MPQKFRTSDLEAYLDEALPAGQMSEMEEALRGSDKLRQQLSQIHGRRDAGVHSLGGIWRRHRLSCPPRDQLGSFLLGALSKELAVYIRFHVEEIGCRFCQANLTDLERLQHEASETVEHRRQKYFHSSAGYLSGS